MSDYTYTVTAGFNGVSASRSRGNASSSSIDTGFMRWDLPPASPEGVVTLAAIEEMLKDNGFTVTGEWSPNELAGHTYYQAPMEKIA